ncbi:MAG: putative 4-hydroxybenzoate polyprenyltransferase [Armatimonadetes bacterium]|nr:putative 4-hydroxybenzoate polyprenyltransferase [Armatimonadota bacterium]
MTKKIALLLDWIKFQHTLFAMPFALMSAILALGGQMDWRKIGWIVVAMVGARSSAMGFNRIVDRDVDALNPRTKMRHLPAGLLGLTEAWAFVFLTTFLFVFAAAQLNRLSLLLSPVALAVVWGYSYTKRFTAMSHLVLGFALGIAPAAAWIGITGALAAPPLILCAAVTLWTAGFDILYSCQDVGFDREHGLHSLPARLGVEKALRLSELFHAGMFLLLLLLPSALHRISDVRLGPIYFAGLIAVGVLLFLQHRLVKPNDLSRLDAAFFTANGFISVGLFLFTIIDVYV